MPEKVMPGPVEDSCGIREAVCIHTRKIFDSCRDKDCIEDLRFYPKLQCVDIINRALSVKGGSAKLLYVYVDVEPVSFNRGFYTVDMRFFYHVTLQAYLSCPVPVTVEGLCVFDKRAILFGSEGNAKIFSSEMRAGEPDPQMMQRSNTPIAVVEAVDPIVLDARIMDCCCKRDCDCDLCEIPTFVGDPGPVLHRPAGAGHPAAGARVRLLYARQGVRLRRRLRGPLRSVPEHLLPGGRVLPAQHRQAAGELRRHQELLQVSGRPTGPRLLAGVLFCYILCRYQRVRPHSRSPQARQNPTSPQVIHMGSSRKRA